MSGRFFRNALRLVPAEWRESVRQDLEEEATGAAGTGARRELWLTLQALAIALRFAQGGRMNEMRGKGPRLEGNGSMDQEREEVDEPEAPRLRPLVAADALRQMVKAAVRSVVRSPALTAGVVVAFALGIGANATMYGILDRLLLSPPSHIPDAEKVRRLFIDGYYPFMRERMVISSLSYPVYVDMTRVGGFAGVAAVSEQELTVGEDARPVTAQLVTGNYFDVLGTRPRLGRFLDESTDVIGGAQEAVISYGMWQRAYGASPDVLGRIIDFGYGPYQIVGVAPRGFTGTRLSRVDLWLPLRVAAAQLQGTQWAREPEGRGWDWLEAVARLSGGATVAGAEAEATTVLRAAWGESGSPAEDVEVIAGSLIEARGPNPSSAALVAKLLAGVSLLVLLIACVNVANLLLARTLSRRRELVVRMALGISRRRVVGQIVLDGVVLGLLGGAAALVVERWGGGLVRRVLLPQIAWDEVGASTLVLPLVLILAVLAGVLSALVPALQVARRDLADTLRQAAAGGITRTTSRVRTTLALSQTALSVMLLVGAGLFVRSVQNVRQLDLGIDADGLLHAYPLALRGAITPEVRGPLFDQVIERLSAIQGVQAVAAASVMPLRAWRSVRLNAEGLDSVIRPPSGGPYLHGVSPDYFETMRLRITRGRGFDARDRAGSPPVAVISENLAAALWPQDEPLGRCLYIGLPETEPPCSTVVGVVEDASLRNLRDEGVQQYYVPLGQVKAAGEPGVWLVRTTGDAALRETIRREILRTDSRIRYAEVLPFQDLIAPLTRSWTLGATMFGIFGALALLVAAIGLYSVLAFDVAQRARELGIRAALGAHATAILSMVLRRAVLVTAAGILIGTAAAALAAPHFQTLLFDVDARDPLTLGSVGATLLLVACAAAVVPAWRAARVDPNTALRTE